MRSAPSSRALKKKIPRSGLQQRRLCLHVPYGVLADTFHLSTKNLQEKHHSLKKLERRFYRRLNYTKERKWNIVFDIDFFLVSIRLFIFVNTSANAIICFLT
ncbi:hypothetical protein CEXT_654151 [Caerostris extrusa]|uniref:Uncharacterized protein n=1 Tax=Caerostris extrusa TaxID=172846 RepID=A0AAV4RYV0_CAEEX|nr:hypothetical protein CEXT_654151 [Caerostris extrusa]